MSSSLDEKRITARNNRGQLKFPRDDSDLGKIEIIGAIGSRFPNESWLLESTPSSIMITSCWEFPVIPLKFLRE